MEILALLLVAIVWLVHTRTNNDLTRRIQALETDLYAHLKTFESEQN